MCLFSSHRGNKHKIKLWPKWPLGWSAFWAIFVVFYQWQVLLGNTLSQGSLVMLVLERRSLIAVSCVQFLTVLTECSHGAEFIDFGVKTILLNFTYHLIKFSSPSVSSLPLALLSTYNPMIYLKAVQIAPIHSNIHPQCNCSTVSGIGGPLGGGGGKL